MAKVVVLGAGLGGVIMAYEIKAKLKKGDTVISESDKCSFVPSKTWVAVEWRTLDDITVQPEPVLRKELALDALGIRKLKQVKHEAA